MATSPENTEMVDANQVDAHPTDSELDNISAEVKPEHVYPSDTVDMELTNTEAQGDQFDPQNTFEQAHHQTTSADIAHPEPLGEEVYSPPPTSENMLSPPEETEHIHTVSLVSDHVNPHPLTYSPPPTSEKMLSPPEETEHIHTVPLVSDHVDPHPLTYSPPPTSEKMLSPPEETEHIHTVPLVSEHANPHALTYSPPPTSEQMLSPPEETEHIHTVPLVSPHAQTYSPPPTSEKMLSPPEETEHVHSMPLVSDHVNPHAQTYSPPPTSEKLLSSPEETEHVHTMPLVSDNVNPQALNGSEIVHTEPVASEMVHAHTVADEMVHPHTDDGSLEHTQPSSNELMYSNPENSDLVVADNGHFHHDNVQEVHLQPVELVNSHYHNNEAPNSPDIGMELVNLPEPLSTEVHDPLVPTPDAQPGKKRKKKSIVWEHFTIETVSAGCRRACCKVCKQSFAYSTGSKVAGTSHLKRHIAKGTCPVILRQQEKNQLSPYLPKSGGTEPGTVQQPKRRYRTSGAPYLIFDQDRCRHEIARMIIMHDYPLHMVEHPGFVSFVQNLQPRFDMVSFNIVQGDCVATFLREKQTLQKFVEGIPGRICLTMDMWTSNQSTGYVFVTGQFIDNDWKLHRRLLNVVMEPFPESDAAFSHAIGTCLSDWGLDRKLASITFNQPLSESGLEKLRALLAVKNPLLFNGQLLIRGCIANTLSGMAQEVLDGGRGSINKVRTSVKYVKTSESHEEKFLELKEQLQVPSEKSLSLDNLTKWNTTYEMLLAASELRQVFSCLDTSDPNYTDSPSIEDWKEVENICMFLKLLHDTAELLTSKTVPSSHVFFHEVWKIQLELARAGASDDIFVSGMAKILQDKFHKYFKNVCLILAIAVAMDPRFKMKLVEFSFTKIFTDEAPVYIRVVDDGMHDLFHEYMNFSPAYGEDGNDGNVKVEDQTGNNGLTDFDMYIMETTSQQMKSELDQYLEESLLPRVQDFDVLGWWKLNKIKYPTLSKMARDILSIPLSTVASESVFDTVPKEMDSYRCSLRPETVEALICAKDWLRQATPSVPTEVVKMEL